MAKEKHSKQKAQSPHQTSEEEEVVMMMTKEQQLASIKKMLENNKLPAAFRKIFERIVAKNEAEAPKAEEPKAE